MFLIGQIILRKFGLVVSELVVESVEQVIAYESTKSKWMNEDSIWSYVPKFDKYTGWLMMHPNNLSLLYTNGGQLVKFVSTKLIIHASPCTFQSTLIA